MTVKENAYAKINLFLDVLGRRDDGYHDVVTLMQSVSLCDEITLTAMPSDRTMITITSTDKSLETDENNLVYKSALNYIAKFKISARVDVELNKRIPIGAGLGGGSSDAAATLRAMNKIYGLATDEQLLNMAAELGSDVPFFLVGGCAACTGRGEKVSPVDLRFYPHIIIAIGKGRVSTPIAYAMLDEKYGDFLAYKKSTDLSEIDIPPIYNIFESVIKSDEIDRIKSILSENGAECTLMSGSGPAVFGGFINGVIASLAKRELEKQGFLAFECETL